MYEDVTFGKKLTLTSGIEDKRHRAGLRLDRPRPRLAHPAEVPGTKPSSLPSEHVPAVEVSSSILI